MILIAAVPVLLYIPAVQTFVKDIALKEVKKSTGMDISIGYIRLKFPLKIALHDVLVLEATGDTLATLGTAGVDVKLLPLLHGDIDVTGAQLNDVTYRLGSPDSAMYLTAYVRSFESEGANMNFTKGNINVEHASLDGADVRLVMKDTVSQEKNDTTASLPLKIHAHKLQLSDIRYSMSMLPIIDSLTAEIPSAVLEEGIVDMATQSIHARYLRIDSIAASYLTPSAQYLSEHPQAPVTAADTTAISAPWSITADSLRLTARTALYAMRDAKPLPGLDMNYIQVNDVAIAVDSFFNRATSITVPLKELHATERCGVRLKAHGTFSMDSTAMHAQGFEFSTLFSKIKLDAMMGMGSLVTDPNLPLWVKAEGNVGLTDIEQIMPMAKTMLRDVPRSNGLLLNADIQGTASKLNVNNISVSLPRYLAIKANGSVSHPMDAKLISGKVNLTGSLTDINFAKNTVLDKSTAKLLTIPPMKLNGDITYAPAGASGHISAYAAGGELAMNGKWVKKAQGYNASVSFDKFPVQAFMPSLGIGPLTGSIHVDGKGYDPTAPSTTIHADAEIASMEYLSKTYHNTRLDATLANGDLTGTLYSHNPEANITTDFSAHLSKDLYTWNINGDIAHLDLQSLGLSATPMRGSLAIESQGSFIPSSLGIEADVTVSHFNWLMDESTLTAPRIDMSILTNDSLTHATIKSGDFNALFSSYTRLDSTLNHIASLTAVLDTAIAKRNADVKAIQHALPPLDLSISAGSNNPVAEYLATTGITFRNALILAHNDSLMSFNVKTLGLGNNSIKTDTLTFDALQHGKYLVYTANLNNRRGTMDQFAHVALRGYLADDKASVLMRQKNIQGQQGFFIGLTAAMTDSLARISFVPHKPTIGYKEWTLNPDNFVAYNFYSKHIDANLELGNGTSLLQLYTEHKSDSLAAHDEQDDVILRLKDILIEDWIKISPFAPPLKGKLGADMRFAWDTRQLTGNGMVSLTDFYNGRDRVGNFNIDLSLFNDKSGLLRADAALMVDSIKVITAKGVLNDSTAASPFLLDFSMIHFPLRIINPFLPKGTAQLSGMLNGQMDITGSMSAPVFNGYLDFDSTAVKLAITGATYKFSEEKIPVDSNIVKFKDFTISGLNNNPLRVNGTVNAHAITNPLINLNLKAENMQLVNSSRPRGADVYGKAFMDLDADVKGNMELLRINANLNLLPETDVTYVMTSTQAALTSQSTGNMVTFVQFSDTTSTLAADTVPERSVAMFLEANLTLSAGCTINVDNIMGDSKNKASIQPEGNLSYTLTPMSTDGRVTGRININKGFVKYTPPFMSEKDFVFTEGSYVAFSGDMLNPRLDITAVDKMKANVTQEGQNSRLVNFDISLSVTNTLQNMNVTFDLSTNDDLTIQNELQGMSPEQRANQAMNMLLYNVYTGPGTKANASLSGNPLYSFLTSQINSWAAQNIKGVDISFGIDQYDKTTDGTKSTATSYSYKVSKTLFNNRFKIVVGGEYSTESDQDENLAENLVNDVSFEYMLNRSGTMYVKIFRHVGYESILEGEITQTGVGFVLKRKINSLRDIFRRQKQLVPQPQQTNPNQ